GLKQLSKANRDKIGEFDDMSADVVKVELESLKTAYKEKYDKELSFKADKAFDEVAYIEAEVKNPDQLAQWPVKASEGSVFDGARTASGILEDDQQTDQDAKTFKIEQ